MKPIFVLLALSVIAHGAASDPGKVAIDFLEKVRVGKLDLAPGGDTALSPQTADGKKREIAKRLERVAHDLGSDPLELGEVKMDDNYAAVLVRKVGGFDPSRLQVFSVALVKRGSDWSAAPLPASFENAGAGYAIALRKRLDLLEDWMLREQVLDLEKLREQSAARMREKIQARLTIDDLRGLDAKAVGRRFLTACEGRDLPVVLGLLGGLANSLPDDWTARLRAADTALSADHQEKHPWRLMTSPDVLRVIVHQEESASSGLFSIACLDPSSIDTRSALPKIEVVEFEIAKSQDGLWRIDPPASFLDSTEDSEEETDENPNADLRDKFPAIWLQLHPATPQPDAAQLYQNIASTLQGGDLRSLLRLTLVEGNPEAASRACTSAAEVWWSLHDPAVVRHALPLAFQENGNAAAGLFQFFSAREPDKLDLKTLYFEKSAHGWLWTPEPDAATRDGFKESLAPEIKRWSSDWQQQLLTDCAELKEISGNPAPTQEEARKVVEAWLLATRSGDVKTALALTARLPDPDGGAAVLRNLGHEIITARRTKFPSEITGTYQSKIWTAVGVKTDQAGKPARPLYPVVGTPAGPRVLIEIDLFASRGREFLNKTALERVQKSGSPAAADELRALFTDFQNQVNGSKN